MESLFGGERLSHLPSELLEDVLAHSFLCRSVVFFPVCCIFSKHVRKIRIERTSCIPGSLIANCFSRFEAGLQELDFGEFTCGDEEIIALGSSNASNTLKRLRLSRNTLTDESKHVWSLFSSLQALSFGSLHRVGLESVEAMASLPLTDFYCDSSSAVTLEDFLGVFMKRKTPLRALTLSNVSNMRFKTLWPKLKLLLADWPRRFELEEANLTKELYLRFGTVQEMLEYHQFFPNLKDAAFLPPSAGETSILNPLPQCFKNLSRITILQPEKESSAATTSSWMSTLARELPNLKDFRTLAPAAFESSEWKLVSSFDGYIGHAAHIPPAVEVLRLLDLHRPEELAHHQLAARVIAISAVQSTLVHLCLPSIPQELLPGLLSALPLLETVDVTGLQCAKGGQNHDPERDRVVISHTKLFRANLPPGSATLGFLPRLRYAELDDWVRELPFDFAKAVPGLESLRSCRFEFNAFGEQLERLASLKTLDVNPGDPATFLEAVRRLPHLSEVHLNASWTEFEWSLATLLEALPAVRVLTFAFYKGSLTLPSKFQHPMLCYLNLVEAYGAGEPSDVCLTGAAFPMLQDVSLSLMGTRSVFLDSLPKVGSVQLGRPNAGGAVEFEIVACPSLVSLHIHEVNLSKLTMRGNCVFCVASFRDVALLSGADSVDIDRLPIMPRSRVVDKTWKLLQEAWKRIEKGAS